MGTVIDAAHRFRRSCSNCAELTVRDKVPYCRAEMQAALAARLPVTPLFGDESYSCGDRYLPKHLERRRHQRRTQERKRHLSMGSPGEPRC